MSDFDLNALIRDTLSRSREPNPHVLARRLVPRIPEDQVRAVLAQCLADRVREAIRFDRMALASSPTPRPARLGSRSRWARSPALRQRYSVAGEWKLLADCTAEDCDVIAEDYARRAAEQAAIERRFRDLATRLRASGAATVADLSDDGLAVAA